MMGRLSSDQGKLFYAFDLDAAVPADHLVREIDVHFGIIVDVEASRAIRQPRLAGRRAFPSSTSRSGTTAPSASRTSHTMSSATATSVRRGATTPATARAQRRNAGISGERQRLPRLPTEAAMLPEDAATQGPA